MNIKKMIASSAVAVALLGTTGIASTTVEAATAIATVDYVPGYGINLWNFNTSSNSWVYAGRKLAHNSRWIANKVAYQDGNAWYLLGDNQWMEGAYLKVAGNAPIENFSWGVNGSPAEVGGVVTIKYVPGYGVPTWNSTKSDRKPNEGKYLKHDTRWKVIRVATDDKGYVWYDLGNNDWIYSGDTDYPSKGNKLDDTDKLAQARKDAVDKINKLENLTDDEKQGFIDQINDQKTTDSQAKIDAIVDAAKKKDAANLLATSKETAIKQINAMENLSDVMKKAYIQSINNASTVATVNQIVTEANTANNK